MATNIEPQAGLLDQFADQPAEKPNPDHGLRYHSREFMDREWKYLWPKVWLLAGVVSDVQETGDYIKFDVGPESFVIVRDDHGALRAFYNVCPHRGMQLVRDDFGSLRQFTCGFHSWEFALDGQNIGVTDADTFRPAVLCNNLDLSAVRCETLGGLVFITMNPDPVPLRDWLGPVADQIEAFNMQDMRPIQHRQSVWGANWKNCIDAFAEVYHLHAVHPQSQGMIDDRTSIDLYPHGMSRQYVPFGRPAGRHGDQVSVNEGLRMMLRDSGIDPDSYTGTAAETRRDMQVAKRARAERLGLDYSRLTDDALTDVVVMSLFPNVQISAHAEAVYLFRFLPDRNEPARFVYDNIVLFQHVEGAGLGAPEWMGLPESLDTTGEVRPDIERVPFGERPNLGLLLDQDADLLPVVQRGLESRGFRGPLWSEQETRLKHFHAELDRYVSGEKERAAGAEVR